MTLQAYLAPVPQSASVRTPDQVQAQRRTARWALSQCAWRCGAPSTGWVKDAREVPLPNDGFRWSISHKRLWSAAVIATQPVGIDVEHLTPRRVSVHDHLAGVAEWELIASRSWWAFYRVWTAKEAVLKANGIGVAGLLKCQLTDVHSDTHLTLRYNQRDWRVEQCYHADHIFAVATHGSDVTWNILAGDNQQHDRGVQVSVAEVPQDST